MWYKQKTTWTGVAAIVAAAGGYFTGEISLETAIATLLGGLAVIFLRQSVAKVAPLVLLSVVACQTPGQGGGATAVPVSTQGAQTIGGSQGQAAETGSATNNQNPWLINCLGAKKVTITQGPTGPSVVIESHDDPVIEIKGGAFGFITYGEDSGTAEVSSGGGQAAGTGGDASGVGGGGK